MMNESERHVPPKNRWTRWYMWVAYGGGILGVIAVVVVIVAMAAAPSGDGETVASHHNMATLTPYEVAALMRQHPSINSLAELDDLQFMANQDGITLEESIARYAWGDDFSMMVSTIEDGDPRQRRSCCHNRRINGPDRGFGFNLRQYSGCHRQIQVRKSSR